MGRHYRSFSEFNREFIRPTFRIGMTVEDIVEDSPFEREYDFDRDPLEEKEDEDEY